MKSFLHLVLAVLIGALAACNTFNPPIVPTLAYSTSAPQPTQVRTNPTPNPYGQVITYKTLRVTMTQAEFTSDYETEYGSRRAPPVGAKFLWIAVQFENISPNEQKLPATEHFILIKGAVEFKPTYGHRKGYPDYTSLNPGLYPGHKTEAWLRFDLPMDADLAELQFVFLPESVQVSSSFPVSGYTWADHPMFSWQCAP